MTRIIQKTDKEGGEGGRWRERKKMIMGWFLVEQVKQTKQNKGQYMMLNPSWHV